MVWLIVFLGLRFPLNQESPSLRRDSFSSSGFQYSSTLDGLFSNESFVGLLPEEHQLYLHLMSSYEKSVRPVYNASEPVNVRLGMALHQLVNLNARDQVLTMNVWLDQTWIDERMVWNISHFFNISSIRIPCHLLWRPDIVLYNSMEDPTSGFNVRSYAAVFGNGGKVFCPVIVKTKSSCRIDTTYFPFDDQICHLKNHKVILNYTYLTQADQLVQKHLHSDTVAQMEVSYLTNKQLSTHKPLVIDLLGIRDLESAFGSWLYDGFQVNVSNEQNKIGLEVYMDNGEWLLVGTKVIRNVVYYPCCKEPYPDVTFYIHIRRRTLFYVFNVVVPCVILSFLTLFAFMLPSDSGEKISLGLTVLLTLFVFALVVAETIPRTSDTFPLIGVYFSVIMGNTSLSIISSAVVIFLYNRGRYPYRAPWFVRKIVIDGFGRLACMTARMRDIHSQIKNLKLKMGYGTNNKSTSSLESKSDSGANSYFNSSLLPEQPITHLIGCERSPLLVRPASNQFTPSYRSDTDHSNVRCGNDIGHIDFGRLGLGPAGFCFSALSNELTTATPISSVENTPSIKRADTLQQSRRGRRPALRNDDASVNIVKQLSEMVCRQQREDWEDLIAKEWQEIAAIMDCCFSYIFFLAFALTAFIVLLYEPLTMRTDDIDGYIAKQQQPNDH